MNRRGFLRGAISVMAMAAVLKGSVAPKYTHVTYGTAWSDPDLRFTDPDAWFLTTERMHAALARSMLQTKEMQTANVLNRAFATKTHFLDGEIKQVFLKYEDVMRPSTRQSPLWVGHEQA